MTITARADDDEQDEYDVKARVARISLMSGEVNLKRNGNQDWEAARMNYPLVEGDTLATGKGSNLEIQIGSQNFVRVTSSAVLRIVTLREEGVAVSLVEGTLVLRLAKFERDHEYFEIDAPNTTMAAEKKGLYRVDAPREGRVRLTVRDGGSARIYSDTAGFTLREGRAAELISSGENAGDWEFSAVTSRDAVDDWVTERDQYFAQYQKTETKYFDEYVWGGEDLDAYGDWINTDAYGWLWRPRASVLANYTDWAPYRYGHWEWCPPYGWTWIGYEPWGWAPYHYGRWVLYNNYWAWCPRSNFYKKRSWWRPALVAFVFDFSFGDNICWYPLGYYQRDPHSRHYRHYDRPYGPNHPGGGGGGGGGGRPNDRGPQDYKPWRGVTRVPRTDFGNPHRRGQAAEEPIARRVVDAQPSTGDLPRRNANAGYTLPSREGDRDDEGGRTGRRILIPQIPNRSTGASDREPGVQLDDDLRRSRVYRGREPRPPQASPPAQTGTTATTPSTTPTTTENPTPETRPTGVINRPEPSPRTNPDEPRSEGRPPGRFVRPTMPEGGAPEKRTRTQQAIENTPRNNPEPRNEQPLAPPVSQPEPPRETRPEPRPEPRTEPRTEPRMERQPESRPEPRVERPQPRFEPRSEPRSEPRTEPRERPEPRHESPRSESPRSESPRSESPRSDPPPRNDPPPRSDPPPRNDPPPRTESPRSETPRESPKPDKPDRPTL